MKRLLCLALASVALWPAPGRAAAQAAGYLKLVRDYADAMIAHGRDTYGTEHSPLFVEALDRKTLRMLEGEALQKAAAIPFNAWGIRPHDRMLEGGNPQHCLNLYQILYALSAVTGEKRYADEADRSLKFFFQHCQSPGTGLLCWGEHAGWDFRTEKRIGKRAGDTHEFYRPWVLWDRSWQLASEPCRRFAVGLWEHQIGDHRTGDYSRHAAIDAHGPDTDAPYARHGGFYIETWATAYEKTRDAVFLKAIDTVLAGLERARNHEGGMLISGSKRGGGRTPYDVSLAVSLGNAADKVPADQAAKMRAAAAATDQAFAAAHAERPAAADQGRSKSAGKSAALWSNAYGGGPPVARANVCMLRYRQVPIEAYRTLVLKTADQYRTQEIDLSQPIWPGTMGSVILLMLDARELSGDEKYLQTAEHFAQKGVELFLTGGPLPRASHQHDHYEAVTNGDTLMLALLQLWQLRHRPEVKLRLVFCDR